MSQYGLVQEVLQDCYGFYAKRIISNQLTDAKSAKINKICISMNWRFLLRETLRVPFKSVIANLNQISN